MHLSHHRGPRVLTTERARREGGYVMAMFGLLLVPLLLMAGLAVDVGSWYNRASDIQKAADAASLAGVVWLPDVVKARQVAKDTAAKNGFDDLDPNIVVTVNPSTKSPRRLQVTIRDLRVGSFFYSNLGGNDIDLRRASYAEYITPVPMGSPRNFFGLGTLTGTGFGTEFLYQSVNPYCTDKENGDRYQSMSNGGTCDAAKPNTEYRTKGYEMYIEAPAGRTAGIDVLLYDPRYNEDVANFTVPVTPVCTTTSELTYPTDTTSGWLGPDTSANTNITITGPLQYRTKSSSTAAYGTVTTLAAGTTTSFRRDRLQYRPPAYTYPTTVTWTGPTGNGNNVSINGPIEYQIRANTGSAWQTAVRIAANSTNTTFTRAGNLLRYRSPTYTMTPVTTCTPNTTTVPEAQIDDERQDNGRDTYTYTLYAADNTPLNDDDNPQVCQKSFAWDAAFDDINYLGSRRWNNLCTISPSGPTGKYILRVNNSGLVSNPKADGSNQWGLVARYTGAAGTGLCDGRVTASCPRVYGKDAISVKAAATANVASFYLAEIGPEHAGKKLKLELFDPGEGGSQIEIQRPTGTNSWTSVNTTWTSDAPAYLSGSGTSISVAGNRFNGRLLQITVDLTGYVPPADNNWWQIKYTFATDVDVTDRTTWSARIVGDPVHLIEEN